MFNSPAGQARRSARAALLGAAFGCLGLLTAGPGRADPLTFEEALARAVSDAPSLRASALGIDAARASATAAGQLPDPRLSFGLDGFPVSGPSAGRFDGIMMTMFKVGIQQDLPSRARRRAEREVADADVDVARARAATTLWQVRIAAGEAWVDLHYAERRLAVLDELLASLEPLWDAAPSGVAASRLRPAQALGPVELQADLEDRRDRLEADLAAARAQLSRWTGDPAPRAEGPVPTIDLDPGAVGARLENLPPLRAYQAAARRAEADVDLARAGRRPDWSFEVGYARRDPMFGDLVSVGASVRLPLFQASRQEPLIAARSADALRVTAEREAAERALLAAFESDMAQYASSRTRWIRARDVILPNLRTRADLETASYAAGAAGLAQILDAFTALANARLVALDREAEVARRAVQITLTYGSGQ
ncbi:TolC family protein [Brevundimonas sp.]|uniref:TolC family protein n=2 Tax=Brevundimonas sp. TaxID=1871086 RepID=UPI0027E608A6|nr:TolC family protein [Brevundimonas sp.]MDQ7812621.1 TolC family protein [Brevundimonas sp.]